ncbi:hypothetical protein AAHH67_00075 [Niallia circulans]
MEVETSKVLTYLLDHIWMIIGVSIALLIIGVLFGLGVTFWKYGRFQISSDKDKIYIKKG